MSTEQNKEIMRRFYEEFWCKSNVDAVDELVDPDFVDHQWPADWPQGLEGLKMLIRNLRKAFPDMHETVEDIIAEGDKVVGRFTLHGTHNGEFLGIPPTGKRVKMDGIDILRIKNGKIVEFWYKEDTLGLFGQLGVFPPDMENIPGSVGKGQQKSAEGPAPAAPWSKEELDLIFPKDMDRLRLMGHHLLCMGSFEPLFKAAPEFQADYTEFVKRVKLLPDLKIETIYGYDTVCYQCGMNWLREEGRCKTGWTNKISKDIAVLKHLGMRTGEVIRLEDLQRLLAEKVAPEDLQRFCEAGEWKCPFYSLGVCQKAYAALRKQFDVS